MKLYLLLLLAAFTVTACAQDAASVASAAADPILDLIPAGYRGLAIALLTLPPILGRIWHAITTNGGLKGIWNALILGTNTPKIVIAGLCVLSLSSCAALEEKAGMSGFDLLKITASAANRAKADYDATRFDIKAARARYAAAHPVTAAKQPVTVTP